MHNVSPYEVFPTAQFIEHDRLRFAIVLVSTCVDGILIHLKIVEKDHCDTGGICRDDLA